MAYDEKLAKRVRKAIGRRGGVAERRMFGGLGFLLEGKMFCGIVKDQLVVRVGSERYEGSLAEAHVRPMDFNGRPMKGWVFVLPAGCRSDKEVSRWVERGAGVVKKLGSASRGAGKKPRPTKTRRGGGPR